MLNLFLFKAPNEPWTLAWPGDIRVPRRRNIAWVWLQPTLPVDPGEGDDPRPMSKASGWVRAANPVNVEDDRQLFPPKLGPYFDTFLDLSFALRLIVCYSLYINIYYGNVLMQFIKIFFPFKSYTKIIFNRYRNYIYQRRIKALNCCSERKNVENNLCKFSSQI